MRNNELNDVKRAELQSNKKQEEEKKYIEIGDQYFESEDYVNARRYYLLSLNINSQSADILEKISKTYDQKSTLERHQAQWRYLMQAVDLNIELINSNLFQSFYPNFHEIEDDYIWDKIKWYGKKKEGAATLEDRLYYNAIQGELNKTNNSYLEAIECFQKAMSCIMGNAYPKAYLNFLIGECYNRIEQDEKAKEAYKESIKIRPQFEKKIPDYFKILIARDPIADKKIVEDVVEAKESSPSKLFAPNIKLFEEPSLVDLNQKNTHDQETQTECEKNTKMTCSIF